MKFKKINEFLYKARKNQIVITISFIVILLASIITIHNAFSIFKNSWNNIPLVNKYEILNNIEKLAPESNINYFKEKLGEPVFIESINEKYKEYIFYDKYYLIQAITNNEEKVVVYSVTTRDKNFNPKVSLGPYEQDKKEKNIYLSKTKFKELDYLGFNYKPDSLLGAHTYSYEEEYYFGNPGFYRTFIFSSNQAGFMASPPIFDKDNFYEAEQYRYDSVINTYTISVSYGQELNKENLGIYFWGVDINKARLISDFYSK